ncbi:MAG: tetratricopeptide repeat protein [Myxococcota bacterium]
MDREVSLRARSIGRGSPSAAAAIPFATPFATPKIGLALLLFASLVACSAGEESPPSTASSSGESAAAAGSPGRGELRYVGGSECARCHPEAVSAWRGSHHDLAMQEATAETVLGDFDDATFSHRGRTSTFRREGDRFVVRTDGPDGEPADFEVAYTFGVDPLQQYLVRFADGRVQALGIAWDARPAEAGGQRWYHLYPTEDLAPGESLHWTGIQQNWNHMCAECHSTGLRKGYSAEEDRFHTRWSEIDVSCEACHGPGSRHVDWAEGAATGSGETDADSGLPVDFGAAAHWVFDEGAAIARRDGGAPSESEMEVCGRCHARRAQLRESDPADAPLLATHRVALLEDGLYHLDGQILDEVYVYGSFRQSRMYQAGVRCRDCHDAHSGELVGGGPADAVCAGCHRPEVFADASHHRHPADSAGARCVACHMPTRTYMGVDERHDHGFRVPRPDLAEELGVPDACTACHTDREPAWASAVLAGWGAAGRAGTPHFAQALRDARAHRAGAAAALAAVAADADQPAIVRATALTELGFVGFAGVGGQRGLLESALADADPLVRLGALGASLSLEPRDRLELAAPLLRDPVLAVRLEAELALRSLPPALWSPADRSALAAVQSEFRAVQALHADRPESWVNLGNLAGLQGDLDAARLDFERALQIEPGFVAALVNLADLDRRSGRDADGEQRLRRAAELAPDNGDVQHALGLALIRLGRPEEAARALARAVLLAPDEPRYALVHALALENLGRPGEAVVALESTLERFPDDVDVLLTLTTWARDRGDWEAAAAYGRRLVEASGGDPRARQLLASIEDAARRAQR